MKTKYILILTPSPLNLMPHFELDNACEAYLGIYSVTGVNAYFSRLGTLQPGAHTIAVSPQIPDGTYLLKVFAGRKNIGNGHHQERG